MKSAYLKPLIYLSPVVFLIIGTYFYFQYEKSKESKNVQVEVSKILELKDRKFTDLKGAIVQIPGNSKVKVIHFWASWCGPCVEEFPQLVELASTNNGDIQVIAISGDSDRAEIDVFLKSFPEARTAKNFSIIWDEKKEFIKEWSVQKLPESYIYNVNNKLAKRISGAVDWLNEDAKAYMKLLIEEQLKK